MLAKLGAIVGIFSDRRALTGLAALACGLLFGALEYGIMRGITDSGLPAEFQNLIDAGIMALGTGTFAWVMLFANRARRRRMREEIARIAELNHEIRNALQVIAHSQYAAKGEHRDLVLQSVSRIDAVMKRVVPMVGVGWREAGDRHRTPQVWPAGGTILSCTAGGLSVRELKRGCGV